MHSIFHIASAVSVLLAVFFWCFGVRAIRNRMLAVGLVGLALALNYAGTITKDYPENLPDLLVVHFAPVTTDGILRSEHLRPELIRRRGLGVLGTNKYAIYVRRLIAAGHRDGWLLRARRTEGGGLQCLFASTRDLFILKGNTVSVFLPTGQCVAKRGVPRRLHGPPRKAQWVDVSDFKPLGNKIDFRILIRNSNTNQVIFDDDITVTLDP